MQLSDISNIVLIGPMASGKTSIGKQIASILNVSFCDTDHIIEQQGTPISDIFAQQGEAHFRQLETECLKQLLSMNCHIIATGGGAPLRAENAELIRSIGAVVFLDADVDSICIRTSKSNHRPLLNRPDKREFITKMLSERRPIYDALADITVESYCNTSKRQLALNVLEALSQCDFKKHNKP